MTMIIIIVIIIIIHFNFHCKSNSKHNNIIEIIKIYFVTRISVMKIQFMT